MLGPTRMLVLVVCACAVALSACGGTPTARGGQPDPAAAMPRDVVGYVELNTDFESGQVETLRELAEKIGAPDPVEALVATLTAGGDANFERDIKPLLGKRLGVGIAGIATDRFMAAGRVTDAAAAEQALSKAAERENRRRGTYKEATYYGGDGGFTSVFDDYLLAASSERDFKRMVDLKRDGGETLADSDTYEDTVEDLPADRVAAGYLNGQGLRKLAQGAEGVDGKAPAAGALAAFAGLGVAVTAREDRVLFDARAAGAGDTESSLPSTPTLLVREAPADSLLALGLGNLREDLDDLLGELARRSAGMELQRVERRLRINLERDVYSWLEEAFLFVRGMRLSGAGGALVARAADERAAATALPRLAAAARRNGLGLRATEIDGAEQAWSTRAGPATVVVARAGDRVVAGLGRENIRMALKPSSTLDSSGGYDRATNAVDGYDPVVIADIEKVLALLEQAGATDELDIRRLTPYLSKLGLAVLGGEEGDAEVARLALTLK